MDRRRIKISLSVNEAFGLALSMSLGKLFCRPLERKRAIAVMERIHQQIGKLGVDADTMKRIKSMWSSDD
jgi:hypothetical protein